MALTRVLLLTKEGLPDKELPSPEPAEEKKEEDPYKNFNPQF